MIGRDRAAEVMKRYATNDLKVIAKAEGLTVKVRHPWISAYHDITTSGMMLVPKDIPVVEQRTIVAHGLGHHFLHVGNQLWLHHYDEVWTWRQEHQAEEFAAWLTIPAAEDPWLLYMPIEDVARKYRITEELARVRFGVRDAGA